MKKIIYSVSVLAIAAVSLISFNSFTAPDKNAVKSETHEHSDCQGKHCTYTVGCDCSGFLAQSGDTWERAYCRRCGHHRSYHR